VLAAAAFLASSAVLATQREGALYRSFTSWHLYPPACLILASLCGAVQYHVVNVFDRRGSEHEFVFGISATFWVTCYAAWRFGIQWVARKEPRRYKPLPVRTRHSSACACCG
jgi:hypothetical protein